MYDVQMVTCIKLASSSKEKSQLNAKQTAHSNTCQQKTTLQHQPAGMQLLECIAVQPWTRIRWKYDAQQCTFDCLGTCNRGTS